MEPSLEEQANAVLAEVERVCRDRREQRERGRALLMQKLQSVLTWTDAQLQEQQEKDDAQLAAARISMERIIRIQEVLVGSTGEASEGLSSSSPAKKTKH
jgi:hypothetical protein